MNPTRRLTVSFVVLLALAWPSVAGARDDTPEELLKKSNPVTSLSEKRVAYFAKQFKAKCARCHGVSGDGGGEEAAQQRVPPRDLTDAAYMGTRSDGELFWQILKGGGPGSPMPAFGPGSDQGWSEEKVWRMVAYVRRFSEKDSDAH